SRVSADGVGDCLAPVPGGVPITRAADRPALRQGELEILAGLDVAVVVERAGELVGVKERAAVGGGIEPDSEIDGRGDGAEFTREIDGTFEDAAIGSSCCLCRAAGVEPGGVAVVVFIREISGPHCDLPALGPVG